MMMKSLVHLFCVVTFLFAAGCAHNSSQAWEDMKTAGRYMQKGVDALWGKEYESRMLTSDEEFIGPDDHEFIPLSDSDLKNSLAGTDQALVQPKGIPGQKGVPSLDQFQTPVGALRGLFQALHFETDEHVLKDKSELQAIFEIASHMKKNPNLYLIVTGHCDERASASYNMALGMRRANYIRGLLVKNGVDLNKVYTVSKGKEEPLAQGHTSEDWRLNRRAEFKIYEK